LVAGPADWGLRTPTTGTLVCCARAASGNATAPAKPAMNFRRLIVLTPYKSIVTVPIVVPEGVKSSFGH
jgi:hypothetical protein